MATALNEIFGSIQPPTGESPDRAVYSVRPIPGLESYLVGKDHESHACLLISTLDSAPRQQPPIRLESLDAQFALRCQLRKGDVPDRHGTFTVIRCRSVDPETIRYFLSVCETILRVIGDHPQQRTVASVVQRLAAILQKIRRLPTRSVTGLFGELFIICRSGNPVRTLKAWRTDETARFDFVDGDIRLDVKATRGRVRAHTFSYDQCNPPPGTSAVVASLFVEQAPTGPTLGALCDEIESLVSGHSDLVLKLHEALAAALGTSMTASLEIAFDLKLAESSLSFFALRDIPAIREPLPEGVSDVHFRSDLSNLSSLTIEFLIDQDPLYWDLLPRIDR